MRHCVTLLRRGDREALQQQLEKLARGPGGRLLADALSSGGGGGGVRVELDDGGGQDGCVRVGSRTVRGGELVTPRERQRRRCFGGGAGASS